jgi:NTE family protein
VESRRRPVDHIDEVRVVGLERVSPDLFEPVVERASGQAARPGELKDDLNRIYGRGDFERVNYRVAARGGRNVLIVDALEKAWGPGYLSFGLGLNSDFKGDSRFGLRATYRQTWINDLGGEWLSTIDLGNEPRLFSEFYQPLNMKQSVFVAPYIDLGQAAAQRVPGRHPCRPLRRHALPRRLDLGANPGGIAELRIGLMAGQVDADLDTGSTAGASGRAATSRACVPVCCTTPATAAPCPAPAASPRPTCLRRSRPWAPRTSISGPNSRPVRPSTAAPTRCR